jgi:disulfide bond formation protein DsbB
MHEFMIRHRRILNAGAALAMALLVTTAYALEHVGGLEPCPLCIFQRLAVAVLGIAFLAAALHHPSAWGSRVYAGLVSLAALVGIGIAGRHLWLQSLPEEQVPACGPGLDYMLDTMPFSQVIRQVLSGSGECAEVDPVMGLPIPVWTLAAYVAALLAGWAINWPLRARRV